MLIATSVREVKGRNVASILALTKAGGIVVWVARLLGANTIRWRKEFSTYVFIFILFEYS